MFFGDFEFIEKHVLLQANLQAKESPESRLDESLFTCGQFSKLGSLFGSPI